MTVGAFDLGTPSLSAQQDAVVTISVVRNLQTPRFLPSNNYVQIIQESRSIGSAILTVTTSDGDTTVSLEIYHHLVWNESFNPLQFRQFL